MDYIEVTWHHSISDEPVRIFSELDAERWEVRKVEQYANGRLDIASQNRETGTTKLSLEAIPSNDEIAKNPEFTLKLITQSEFEEV